jgi:hypothetical protein
MYGLPALYRLDQLAVRRPLTLAAGQSSYERDTEGESAGNDDRDNFHSRPCRRRNRMDRRHRLRQRKLSRAGVTQPQLSVRTQDTPASAGPRAPHNRIGAGP